MIIKSATLRRFWQTNKNAETELAKWIRITDAAIWRTPADVKRGVGVRVDFVKVSSGNTVAVFDIANNNYRLIAAIHYDFPRIFVLRIFTHKEYDTHRWKEEL